MVELISLETITDNRGHLIALEEGKGVPFQIKRIYYLFKTTAGASRGFHAHKNLKQFVICMNGSCTFDVESNGIKNKFYLNDPSQAILLDGVVWREIHDMSADCVLVVLASDLYDESDYIRDYQSFKNYKA